MRITTLSENTAGKEPKGLLGEYGLSILIETDDHKILFDTGQKIAAVKNAEILGVELGDVEKIVISHGHFDHTGGLKAVLEKTGEIEIVANPDIFQDKYAKRKKSEIPIGIPYSKDELEAAGARFNFRREPTVIGDITVTGEIEQNTSYETIDEDMCVKKNDELVKDELHDDQALALKTDKGLFVVLGCAHRGMINTIEQAKKITKEDEFYGVIGGTHLIAADSVQMDETIKALREYNLQLLGVSHCTGPKASARLRSAFGDLFFNNNAGSVIEI
ncbi:MAG: MBL fold metallo-hydrolase [Halobacteriota archaeon]|nr:MBL fold metallo-hydrolase [Halobacteriota archaeon]